MPQFLGIQSAIAQVLNTLAIPQLGVNALDFIIIGVVIFYIYEGYKLGLLLAAMDLASFVFAFVIALKLYGFGGTLLVRVTHMPVGFANAIGFFLIAFIGEVLFNILFRKVYSRMTRIVIPPAFERTYTRIDHILGIIPGMVSAYIILSFILTVLVSFPTSPVLKKTIASSRFGETLVSNSQSFEKGLNSVFGGAINDTLNFLTVKPESNETVNLNFTVTNPTVDAQAELEMFRLVNLERIKAGKKPLVFTHTLRDLGRAYSQDMFQRGYFSHYNLEKQSPFDRMETHGITYQAAGENLALAPSTDLAMQGLMHSPGHRANILSPDFGHIGIGVMDGGIYGKMYTQEFTD